MYSYSVRSTRSGRSRAWAAPAEARWCGRNTGNVGVPARGLVIANGALRDDLGAKGPCPRRRLSPPRDVRAPVMSEADERPPRAGRFELSLVWCYNAALPCLCNHPSATRMLHIALPLCLLSHTALLDLCGQPRRHPICARCHVSASVLLGPFAVNHLVCFVLRSLTSHGQKACRPSHVLAPWGCSCASNDITIVIVSLCIPEILSMQPPAREPTPPYRYFVPSRNARSRPNLAWHASFYTAPCKRLL